MTQLARSWGTLLASLATLALGACSTLTPSSDALKGFVAVPNYSKAPCEYQRQWAAHNSRVATLKEGKEVVYKAPCDMQPGKKPPAAAGAGPKVSSWLRRAGAPHGQQPIAVATPHGSRAVERPPAALLGVSMS